MSAENPSQLGWLKIIIPNKTLQDHVDGLVFDAADHLLEEVSYVSGDFTRVGTIVEASLMAKGKRILEPIDSLNPAQKIERDRIESMFPDFEFDEN